MVRDGDDVEAAGLAVQIDHLADGQPSVAPVRMYMEIAEEKGFAAGHVRLALGSSFLDSRVVDPRSTEHGPGGRAIQARPMRNATNDEDRVRRGGGLASRSGP